MLFHELLHQNFLIQKKREKDSGNTVGGEETPLSGIKNNGRPGKNLPFLPQDWIYLQHPPGRQPQRL